MKSQVEINPVTTDAPAAPAAALPGDPSANGNGRYNGSVPRIRTAPAARRGAAPYDWWPFIAGVGRHWLWLLVPTVIFAIAGVLIGSKFWGPGYTATAQLVRYGTPDPQVFQTRSIAPATLAGLVESPEVRARVGAHLDPKASADEVARRFDVQPVPNSEMISIAVTNGDAATAAKQANLYAEEAVKFTQEMQTRDARDAASYLTHQLDRVNGEIASTTDRLREIGPVAGAASDGTAQSSVTNASPFLPRLQDARIELAELQARYTDIHPLVQQQAARVAALEKQVQATTPAASPSAGQDAVPAASAAAAAASPSDVALLSDKARALETERRELAAKLQSSQLLAGNPPGYFQIVSPAAPDRAVRSGPGIKIALLAAFLGVCGLILGICGAATDELFDRRLRTPDDIRRVTRLPVLAQLGPIEKMNAEERSRWAFRTWTILQSRMSATPNHGLICGITSANAGEGRSLWVKMLAEAASRCGFRVITMTTRERDEDEPTRNDARPASATSAGAVRFRTRQGEPKSAEPVLVHETILSDGVLVHPEDNVDELLAPEGSSVVHIPLPGWVWNLERRRDWLASLDAWSAHENVVVLVELPPASNPETVLLAQNLPNVVWLSDRTNADALETARQIETLRLARCNLVGAFVNRSNGMPVRDRLVRWMPAPAYAVALLAVALAWPSDLRAQDSGTFSVVSPSQRAEWQRHLTLGPGDVLRLSIFGEPQLTDEQVIVQPDGRISYLEARDVRAAGATIDELRERLDQELGKYRRSARTMVTPVEFRSKTYHVMGLVAQKGAFTLSRPMTVVEAVARAGGFETGFAEGGVVEMVDLSRAFLVRDGKRQEVNFERLFNSGDLSQNVAVEPGDYLYFPPAELQQVFVLGEVVHPGPATLMDQGTSLRAIAMRGGFSPHAWRDRVLVVRGSLTAPKPITVNLSDVMNGRTPDVTLEPRDIVYVSSRPWWKAEELLDEAASAFTKAVVVYWTSDKVIPVVPLQ